MGPGPVETVKLGGRGRGGERVRGRVTYARVGGGRVDGWQCAKSKFAINFTSCRI